MLSKFNQDAFDKDYFVKGAKGGYLEYTKEKQMVLQKHKLTWIKRVFKGFSIKSIFFTCTATGLEVVEAKRRGYKAYGCDMSDYALDHLETDGIVKADVRELPFKDNKFHLVCCFDAIHTVDWKTRYKAYKELNRIASRGVVIRTRVLHPDYGDQPEFDGTQDGIDCYRETFYTVIKGIESFRKFKFMKLDVTPRFQSLFAFGKEEYLGATYKSQERHERRKVEKELDVSDNISGDITS